jgi:hypothetical protein
MPNVHKTADSPIIALERDYNADRDNSDRDHKHRVNNEEVEDPVDAYAVALKMTRVEAFHQVFDSPIKLSAFWAAFVLRAVALAVSTNTTYLYLAFATSYFEDIRHGCRDPAFLGQAFLGKLTDMSAMP